MQHETQPPMRWRMDLKYIYLITATRAQIRICALGWAELARTRHHRDALQAARSVGRATSSSVAVTVYEACSGSLAKLAAMSLSKGTVESPKTTFAMVLATSAGYAWEVFVTANQDFLAPTARHISISQENPDWLMPNGEAIDLHQKCTYIHCPRNTTRTSNCSALTEKRSL